MGEGAFLHVRRSSQRESGFDGALREAVIGFLYDTLG